MKKCAEKQIESLHECMHRILSAAGIFHPSEIQTESNLKWFTLIYDSVASRHFYFLLLSSSFFFFFQLAFRIWLSPIRLLTFWWLSKRREEKKNKECEKSWVKVKKTWKNRKAPATKRQKVEEKKRTYHGERRHHGRVVLVLSENFWIFLIKRATIESGLCSMQAGVCLCVGP